MAVRLLSCWVLTTFWLSLTVVVDAAEPSPKGIDFFEKKIRPVLIDHCYKCHSTEAKASKGGLLLDTAEGVLKGGESGAALVSGDPESSLIMEALRHEGLEMPPDKKLSEQVVADFAAWIKLGAPDPRQGVVVAKASGDSEAARNFWAFQPPKKVARPQVKTQSWSRAALDDFVLASLEANDLRPVADADRRVLVRRLFFDLIGLPPTPQEMQQFLEDRSPRALENLVDQLLESPRFGERWGRHWLDVARYAESNGNVDNILFGHAWRYRDYVIAALNADKPFDRFVTEQLAGDLLPSDSPQERDQLLVATGFLALGSKPRAQNNPDFQMDLVAEQLDVTTTGFMALTVACARCHDHKFDPIPTTEYYAMAGIFTSTETLYGPAGRGNNNKKGPNGTALHSLSGDPREAESRQDRQQQLVALQQQRTQWLGEIKQLEPTVKGRPDKAVVKNKNKEKNKAKNKKPKPKPVDESDAVEAATTPSAEAASQALAAASERLAKLNEQVQQADADIKKLEGELVTTHLAMGARDGKVGDCKLCLRGDSRKLGDAVPRGFVSVVAGSQAPQITAKQSGRLELAQWIASPDNPLTARVVVNRIWRHLLGRGIVPTVDNFGVLGEKPSHPELLDHLAVTFVEQGWSIKKMIRQIVLSRTYGLSSDHDAQAYEKDPDNVYLWRHSPHRLDAESLRDAILAVSGKLNPEPMSGSAIAQLAGQDIRTVKLSVNQLADAKGMHRSVYLPVLRNKMPEALDLFDVADPSLVVGHRDTTTVPSQSLYLMNSPMVVQQSVHFANRLLDAKDPTDAQRLETAFRLALARGASEDEALRGLALVQKAREAFAATPAAAAKVELQAWSAFCQALYASAEFRYVE